MKRIELTKGQIAWVDDWNFEWINQWKWSASWSGKTKSYYAVRVKWNGGNQQYVAMHRVIMNTPRGLVCDHINHDTLLNLESNLRNCSFAENGRNRGKGKNNTSGYKGARWAGWANKWRARIMYNGKDIHLGYYDTIVEAALAYDRKAKELFGEFALLNFPE